MIDARRRHELRDRVDARRAEAQALRHAVRDPFLRKLLSRGLAVLNEIDRLFLGPVDTTRRAEVEATWLTAAEKRYAIASAMISRVQEDGAISGVGDDFPTASASVGESPNETRGGSQDDWTCETSSDGVASPRQTSAVARSRESPISEQRQRVQLRSAPPRDASEPARRSPRS